MPDTKGSQATLHETTAAVQETTAAVKETTAAVEAIGTNGPLPVISATTANPPAQATTTSEEDRGTLGQRRVNLMWESTQGLAALSLVATACFGVLKGRELATEFWLLLGIVVNSYFTRTNHTKIGGVGGTNSR